MNANHNDTTELGASISELTAGLNKKTAPAEKPARKMCPYCHRQNPETVPSDKKTPGRASNGVEARTVVTLCCQQFAVPTDAGLRKLTGWVR